MNGISEKIYNAFKEKYGFGECGLFESLCIASTKVKNIDLCLSGIIIAPSGDAKTSILKDIHKIFKEDVILFDGLVTEYHLAKESHKLSEKPYCIAINDLVDIIKTLPKRRVAGILSFLKNIIDGHAQILTARDNIDIKAKVSIIMNIPKLIFDRKSATFVTTTFIDRTIPFNFEINWNEWKNLYLENKLKEINIEPIKLEEREIKVDEKYKHQIVNKAEELSTLKYTGLARNVKLVKALLCGNALLNNRNEINDADFEVFDKLKSFFKW
ncbi:MAG: hypothetical protein QW734_03735 [Candidatus Bathyarchaeia archaeon]